MSILTLVKMDLKKYAPSANYKQIIKILLISHSFHLVLWIRIGQFFRSLPVVGFFFGALVEYFIRVVFSSDISCKARIGGGLMIVHGHDIVIGSEVIIGQRCKIMNGVTLGNKDTEVGTNNHPVIGDDVVIGTGAKILGGITVGDNSRVGANSVVLKDVEKGYLAVGVPARTRCLK